MSSSTTYPHPSQGTVVLPTMNDCIQNLCPSVPPPTEGVCTICQISFGEHSSYEDINQAKNTDESQNDEGEDIIQCPCPGSHVFHRTCLLGWFSSIHDKRTQCPNCNAVLCRPNLFTPAQAAEHEADREQQVYEAFNFDRARFEALMAETDRRFEEHRSLHGLHGLSLLVEEVQLWHEEENAEDGEFLSDDHEIEGEVWIQRMIAQRVMDHIRDLGITVFDPVFRDVHVFLVWIENLQEGYDPREQTDPDAVLRHYGRLVPEEESIQAQLLEEGSEDEI